MPLVACANNKSEITELFPFLKVPFKGKIIKHNVLPRENVIIWISKCFLRNLFYSNVTKLAPILSYSSGNSYLINYYHLERLGV